jgi:hypothetical protein
MVRVTAAAFRELPRSGKKKIFSGLDPDVAGVRIKKKRLALPALGRRRGLF